MSFSLLRRGCKVGSSVSRKLGYGSDVSFFCCPLTRSVVRPSLFSPRQSGTHTQILLHAGRACVSRRSISSKLQYVVGSLSCLDVPKHFQKRRSGRLHAADLMSDMKGDVTSFCAKKCPSTGAFESGPLHKLLKNKVEEKAWLEAIPAGHPLGACHAILPVCVVEAPQSRSRQKYRRRPSRDLPALDRASCTVPDSTSANVQLLKFERLFCAEEDTQSSEQSPISCSLAAQPSGDTILRETTSTR